MRQNHVDEPNDASEKKTNTTMEQVQQEVHSGRRPWYRTLHLGRILALIYFVQFLLFTLLAWFVHVHPILPIDVAITREFQENKAPWLEMFMIAISYLGGQPILFPALIFLTGLAFWLVRLRLEGILIVALSLVSAICNTVIKLIVSRPRPNAHLVDIFQTAKGESFPSGHVMYYVAYWGLLFSFGLILFKRDRWWHYLLLIVPAFFVVMVGPSRIYLGDHWASDVLGGYLFGGLLLGITLWVYVRLKRHRIFSSTMHS